jgi:hypothetical protein
MDQQLINNLRKFLVKIHRDSECPLIDVILFKHQNSNWKKEQRALNGL